MAYSGQERIAFETGYADGIYGRPRENPYNISTVPKSWRAYEEGYDEGEGSTTPPRGPAGPQGEPGEQGSQGVPGINGQDGADGLNIYQGSGPPVDGVTVPVESKPGDKYIDNASNGALYEKTGVSTWTFVSDLADVALATEVDDLGGSPQIIYVGNAQPGTVTSAASWRVQRVTVTTDGGGNDDVSVQWADGNNQYDNVWDNRAALAYS